MRLQKRIAVGTVGLFVLLMVVGFSIGCGGQTQNDGQAQPANTEQPASGLTADEQSYLGELATDMSTMGEALGGFSKLSTHYPFTQDETIELAGYLATWRVTHDKYHGAKAPSARLQKLHSLWHQALDQFNKASLLVADGLDNDNVGLINAANKHMARGATLSALVNKEIGRVVALDQ